MLIGLAVAGAPVLAWAQASPPQPTQADKPPASTAVEGVTVTATVPDVQTTIDRRSFTLGKDLQGATGSIGDALRNVPSVEVDLQGKLSMRGDPNVTILIDGKPAPQFQGAGRADALQQLSADQFERVEVITNSSAEVNPEGSGVINLISRKNRGSGVTGSAYLTDASAGSKRAGITLGDNSPELSVTASLAGSDQQNKSHTTDLRDTIDPATGAVTSNLVESHGRNRTRTLTENLNLTYTAMPKDQLTAKLQASQMWLDGRPSNQFTETEPSGTLQGFLDRQGTRPLTNDTNSLAVGWRHSFTGEDHEFSLDLLRNETVYADHVLWQTLKASPPVALPFERVSDAADWTHSELTLSYKQPLPGGATLKSGYELKFDHDDFPFRDFRGVDASALAEVPSLANHFLYRQTIHAVFVTYDRSVGDLSLQAGLRFEDVRLDLDQLTSGERDTQRYDRLYPTLHLNYRLDADRKLTASFSERVNRPDSVLLNPLRYVIDPENLQQGNPNLKPQITQSYELGFEENSKDGGTFSATLYYRRNEGEASVVLIDLGQGMFEQTYANLGRSRAAGLELLANGKLLPTLSFNASTNLFWKEISAEGLGVAGTRSAVGVSGRANLDWQVRKQDLVQFNLIATGQRLQAQGSELPVWTVNLGWRHKFDERTTLTLTAQDILASNRYAQRLDTAQLMERYDYTPVTRVLSLRLDYRFGGGGKPAREPGFEYENAAPAESG